MKWRQISELGDEQKDGRWWIFSIGKEFEPTTTAIKFLENEWVDDLFDCVCIDEKGIPKYKYFLSEPLPDFPKPLKMEWRKFNEVSPCQDQLILVSENVGSRPFVVTFCDGLTNYKTHWYWMPIVPPEGE
ncbi:MAG: hypothetical protein RLZZ196_1492 [Bacteroidota bacterium]|jgi:hypothetical protein